MRARLTSRNRVTLPETLLPALGGAEYLEAVEENGRIVPTPVRVNDDTDADAVRAKLAELDLTEADVADAVAWARSGR